MLHQIHFYHDSIEKMKIPFPKLDLKECKGLRSLSDHQHWFWNLFVSLEI